MPNQKPFTTAADTPRMIRWLPAVTSAEVFTAGVIRNERTLHGHVGHSGHAQRRGVIGHVIFGALLLPCPHRRCWCDSRRSLKASGPLPWPRYFIVDKHGMRHRCGVRAIDVAACDMPRCHRVRVRRAISSTSRPAGRKNGVILDLTRRTPGEQNLDSGTSSNVCFGRAPCSLSMQVGASGRNARTPRVGYTARRDANARERTHLGIQSMGIALPAIAARAVPTDI
ncbi:hypothetical protein DFR29_12120 [Tahibacter aquaticus]|uniref:Uncharacterized protein n=1 Tax=Tahibacter aquaticus TaxID=520092 RepID=A0A4R6YM53_9GAMM|nr:hypothetical protein DFR29_12120 [Tahibacter aquaticus]